MKAQVLIILAAIIIFPLVARTQIEGGKLEPGTQSERQVTNPQLAQQDAASIQATQPSGGGTGNYMVYDQSGMYLEPGWTKGYVVLSDKSMMEDVMLRYDIYHQQMQFIREDDTLAFSNPLEVDYLYLGQRKFVYCDYLSNNALLKGYFEVLHEGECPLYVHRYIRYHLDPEERPTLNTDVYVRECGYYVKKQGQPAEPIKPNRKSILCVFKDKETEVAKFMDDNHLSGKTCDELKLVIAFYNSIP